MAAPSMMFKTLRRTLRTRRLWSEWKSRLAQKTRRNTRSFLRVSSEADNGSRLFIKRQASLSSLVSDPSEGMLLTAVFGIYFHRSRVHTKSIFHCLYCVWLHPYQIIHWEWSILVKGATEARSRGLVVMVTFSVTE